MDEGGLLEVIFRCVHSTIMFFKSGQEEHVNGMGPDTNPCGTPWLTSVHSEELVGFSYSLTSLSVTATLSSHPVPV